MIEFSEEEYNKSPSFALDRPVAPASMDAYSDLRDQVGSALHDRRLDFNARHDAGITVLEAARYRHAHRPPTILGHLPVRSIAEQVVADLPDSGGNALTIELDGIDSFSTSTGLQIVARLADSTLVAQERESALAKLEELSGKDMFRKDRDPCISLGSIAVPRRGPRPDLSALLDGIRTPEPINLQPIQCTVYQIPMRPEGR
jgi:hypothetical protein